MADSETKNSGLIILGTTIALGMVVSTFILSGGIIKYQKLQNQTITVTGSASEKIMSDYAVLNFGFETRANDLKSGYNIMASNREKIKKFLIANGINEQDINFQQISNYEVNKRMGNYTTNEVDFYKFNSSVRASSGDIEKIKTLSNKIEELINENIQINYSNVEYLVSKLDDIKVKMIGEATKNAKERARSMVKSTGDSIGSLNSAKTGVFQIVPVNSNEVSDYGINDTTSPEKKIVAVVNATFTVK